MLLFNGVQIVKHQISADKNAYIIDATVEQKLRAAIVSDSASIQWIRRRAATHGFNTIRFDLDRP